MIKMTSVEWLLNNLTDSVECYVDLYGDFHWNRMLVKKSGDPQFIPLIDRIMDEGFSVPICLVQTKSGWLLGNGHHRMTAAILLCLEEIPVFFNTKSDDYMANDITSPRKKEFDSYTAQCWRDSMWISSNLGLPIV